MSRPTSPRSDGSVDTFGDEVAALNAQNDYTGLQKRAREITSQEEFEVLRDVTVEWTEQANTLPLLERASTYKVVEDLLRACLSNGELPPYAKAEVRYLMTFMHEDSWENESLLGEAEGFLSTIETDQDTNEQVLDQLSEMLRDINLRRSELVNRLNSKAATRRGSDQVGQKPTTAAFPYAAAISPRPSSTDPMPGNLNYKSGKSATAQSTSIPLNLKGSMRTACRPKSIRNLAPPSYSEPTHASARRDAVPTFAQPLSPQKSATQSLLEKAGIKSLRRTKSGVALSNRFHAPTLSLAKAPAASSRPSSISPSKRISQPPSPFGSSPSSFSRSSARPFNFQAAFERAKEVFESDATVFGYRSRISEVERDWQEVCFYYENTKVERFQEALQHLEQLVSLLAKRKISPC